MRVLLLTAVAVSLSSCCVRFGHCGRNEIQTQVPSGGGEPDGPYPHYDDLSLTVQLSYSQLVDDNDDIVPIVSVSLDPPVGQLGHGLYSHQIRLQGKRTPSCNVLPGNYDLDQTFNYTTIDPIKDFIFACLVLDPDSGAGSSMRRWSSCAGASHGATAGCLPT